MGLPYTRFVNNQALCKRESIVVVGVGSRDEVLKCQACNKVFSASNTGCIGQHVKGKKHPVELEKWQKKKKKQAHLDAQGRLDKTPTATQSAINTVNKDTLEMLAFTGTPIYLVSKPAFKEYAQTHINFGGNIKRADHLVEDHLPDVMRDHETALSKMLHNVREDGTLPFYSLVVDEQTDKYVQYMILL